MTARSEVDTLKPYTTIQTFSILCVLVGIIVFAESIDNTTLLGMHTKDSMHSPVFFAFTLLLFALASRSKHLNQFGLGVLSGMILLICFIAGIMIEMIQPFFGRDASFLDVWYDITGSASAILLVSTSHTKKLRALAYPAAVFLISIAAVRPSYYAWVEREANESFPLLIDFEHNWQKELYKAVNGAFLTDSKAPESWSSNSSNTIKLSYETDIYPGINIRYFPKDWTEYSTLACDIYSKQNSTFSLSIRVHDIEHNEEFKDRFNTKRSIAPGLNQIEISLKDVLNAPENRPMNMRKIEEVTMFIHKPTKTGSFYLDNVRLKP